MSEKKEIKKGDWVLCPMTKDDINEPTIVAKTLKVDERIVTIELANNQSVTIPRAWCRTVLVQNLPK